MFAAESSDTAFFPFDPVDAEGGGTRPRAASVPTHRPHAWNSGVDVGLLLMRLVLGAAFVVHGSQKLVGAFGGPGVDGFAAVLAGYGFGSAHVLSVFTGAGELVAGVLVAFGFLTSLAAAALLGVLVVVVALTARGGFLAADPHGVQLHLALAALAAGLTLTGPGRVALDRGRSWFRHQVASGWTCLLVGVAAAVALLLGLR